MPPVDAPISAVTVYTDRARVTRTGKITLQPGDHTLTVENLPNTLESDSVRASGRGAGVRISGVEVKTAFVTAPPEAAIAELEKRIEELQESDKTLLIEDNILNDRVEFLERIRVHAGENFGKTIPYKEAEPQDITALADYFKGQLTATHEQRRVIERKRADLAKEIEAAQKRLRQVQPDKKDERRAIHVGVEVEREVEFELEVIYAVRNAAWQPLYDVRLVSDEVTVTYLATISQRSGEDWPEVELSLSTARPAISATLPELKPWYVAPPAPLRPVPVAPAAAQPMAGGARMMFSRLERTQDLGELAAAEEVAVTPAAPPPQAAVARTTIDSAGSGAVTYRVARPVAVPSDGSPHKTTVTIERLGVSLDYITVPKLAQEAYLRATITNTSEYTLLPGEASIFHGDTFVGKTRIETVAPTEEFKVQLGVDDRVRVKRELVKREVSKKLIGNNRRTQFAYKITLTNHVPAPAKVTLFDQIPLAQHESIKVRLEEAAPKPDEQSDLNILKWELELQTGEKREVTFNFIVDHPRDMIVQGLV